jgi:Xaa-Pro aminopeptidase
MHDRQLIERVGETFSLNRLLVARSMTRKAIRRIARCIEPGMIEEDAVATTKRLLKDWGMLRGWHAVHIRFGPNTLKRFGEPSEPGVRLRPNDIFFIDIGPVFQGYEGDGGDTFVVGDDPEMHEARRAARHVFAVTRKAWLCEELSGQKLYEVAQNAARKRGWELNLDMSGHRISDFPHAVHFDGGLAEVSFAPAPGSWVLEIQVARPGTPFSAFYEDLLLKTATAQKDLPAAQ